jgi:hypothetical protein
VVIHGNCGLLLKAASIDVNAKDILGQIPIAIESAVSLIALFNNCGARRIIKLM